MAASKYDFSIEQGSSFRLSIVHRDDSGNPIDMTGYCARLTWKTSGGELMVFSSENTNYAQLGVHILYNFYYTGYLL